MSPSNTLAEVITAISSGPGGPGIGAFFDFDGTVMDGYSARAFYRERLLHLEIGPVEAAQTLLAGLRGLTSEEDFERFVAISFAAWAGRSEDELAELGERLFVQQIASRLFPEIWELVAAHQQRGHTVVLASSATRFQVEPAAHALGVEHVLCTPLEAEDGILTGRAAGPTLWRNGKAAAVLSFAQAHDIDLTDSYAYSNGDEDVPFLSAAGHPHAVNPEDRLAQTAAERGWPVLRFGRRGRPGAQQLARTAAAYAGMFTAMGAGTAVGLLNRSRRRGVDTAASLAGELGLGLAGVQLNVQGEQHLWDSRPAVFLFNHQSQLDMLIVCKLLRGGFAGVAKKELANDPIFGAAFRLADTAFVDRSSTTEAKRALEPAVQRLREGVSLVVAPEGTRSPTPRLRPFKKGAFHMAMQAEVPLVPIVIRNAGELMWRDSRTIRPGRIDVVVHPAVPTRGWTKRRLDDGAEQVHQLYLDTLAHWPERVPGAVA